MVDRLLRRTTVEEATGLGRSTIYKLIDSGDFPRPVKLTGKIVAWRESDITAWIESRVSA